MAGSKMSIKKIAKILLWLFLGIIALPIILLLLIIFFVLCLGRVKYNVDAQVGDEKTARVEISYFLRLVKLIIIYAEGKTETRGRIAWVRIGEHKPQKEKPRKKKRHKKNRKKPKSIDIKDKDFASIGDVIDYAKAEMNSTDHVRKDKDNKIATTNTEQEAESDCVKRTHATHFPIEKPSSPEEEPAQEEEKSGPSFIEKAKQIRTTLTEIDVKTIIGLVFQCLHKFVKAIKPKRLDISGVVGFDDPAATGWFMGAYEAAAGVTGLRPHIRLLGSYHEKALRLDIQARGRFRLGRLFTPFVWLYLKKPIRTLIHKHLLRKGEK